MDKTGGRWWCSVTNFLEETKHTRKCAAKHQRAYRQEMCSKPPDPDGAGLLEEGKREKEILVRGL